MKKRGAISKGPTDVKGSPGDSLACAHPQGGGDQGQRDTHRKAISPYLCQSAKVLSCRMKQTIVNPSY